MHRMHRMQEKKKQEKKNLRMLPDLTFPSLAAGKGGGKRRTKEAGKEKAGKEEAGKQEANKQKHIWGGY